MPFKAVLALGGLVLAVSLTGCGGNDDNGGVATADGTPDASASAGSGGSGGKEAGLKYAQCMRENGVAEWPDPEVDDNGRVSYNVPDDIPDSVINAAEEKCREHRPFGPPDGEAADPQRIEQLREHSECIRENGIPDFPDPEADGSRRIDFDKLGLSGPEDPKFKAAQEKCQQALPSAPPGARQGSGG